jgi:hypothetical protein
MYAIRKSSVGHPGDAGEKRSQLRLIPDSVPILGKEFYLDGSNQLLQCPAPFKPSTLSERSWTVQTRDILQVDITRLRLLIPAVHGVYRLRQPGAAPFINTTSVDPHPVVPVPQRLGTAPSDLLIASLSLRKIMAKGHIFEGDFVVGIRCPSMGEDGIPRDMPNMFLERYGDGAGVRRFIPVTAKKIHLKS